MTAPTAKNHPSLPPEAPKYSMFPIKSNPSLQILAEINIHIPHKN